jgi:hypothetical protein
MRSCNGGSLSNHQEVLIKRYYEIHFDYSTEFKNTSVGYSRPAVCRLIDNPY